MIRPIAAALPVLFAVNLALAAEPSTQPVEHNPAMADSFYQAAKSAANAEQGLTAVRKALEYDPDHALANLLLAELLLKNQQAPAAAEQFAKAQALIARQANLPADVKARADSIGKQLADTQKLLPRWTTLRQQFATRYASLGEEATGAGMSSTALAFARACVLKPGDAQLTGQRDRAMAAIPRPPAPAAKADPAGAKILHDQADALTTAGRFDQAGELLKTAVTLDPTQPEPWCDLGLCCLKGKERNGSLAAVCLAEAKKNLENLQDADAAKKLAVRIRDLEAQADPKMVRLDQADQAFVAAGRLLKDDAAKAGDKITAEQVTAAVLAATGQSIGKAASVSIAQGDWIDALNMVWPRKDGGGDWYNFVWSGDGLVVRRGSSWQHVALPVTVEGDYELLAEWEVTADKTDKADKKETSFEFDLPVGSTAAKLHVGESHSGLGLVSKAWDAKDNPTLAGTPKSAAGKIAQLAVSVKVAGKSAQIIAQLDNRPLIRWEGLISALGDPDPKAACPGITVPVRAIIHRFDLRSARGKIQPTRRMDPFVSGPGNLSGKIDLASRDIEVAFGYGQKPMDQKVTQARDHVVIQRLIDKTGGRVRLTLGNLMFTEPTRLVVGVETDGVCDVAFGPGWGREDDGNTDHVGAISLRVKAADNWVRADSIANFLKTAGCEVAVPPDTKLVDVSNPEGIYTVCFEQFGKVQNAWVNSLKVLEAKLPDELVKQAPHLPMNLWVTVVKGQKVKVTLRELRIGKDLPPYQPPAASQPDSP